jgi:hypothetical protein
MSHTLLQVRPSKPSKEKEKEAQRGPLYTEPALAALHSLKGVNAGVGLEVGMSGGRIALFVRATDRAAGLAESQLYAQYPDIEIDILQKDPFLVSDTEEVYSVDLVLTGPEVFPIKRHPQFDDLLSRTNVDPIAGITSTLSRSPIPGMRGHVQVCVSPIGSGFRRRALRFLPLLRRGFSKASDRYANSFARVGLARGWRRLAYWPLATFMGGFRAWPIIGRLFTMPIAEDAPMPSDGDEERVSARSHDREDAVSAAQDKVNRLLFLCNVRLSVIAPKGQRAVAEQKLEEMVGSFRQFTLPHSNGFKAGRVLVSAQIPRGVVRQPFTLSVEEIATLWHLPTPLVQTPNIDWVTSRKLEPPNELPVPGMTDEPEQITDLGEAVFRGRRTRFGIRTDDRRRHIYIIGKTGMGKSTLLENMIVSDIVKGRGVGVIDPHGDLIEAVQRCIPKSRSNDVIFFDPSDVDHPISFNVLHCPDPQQRTLTASGLMSVFTKLWPGTFSGRMEHVLRNTLLALLEFEGSSMLGIMRMYADEQYRRKVVANVSDPLVKSFWDDEYASWSDKYRTEAVAAIQNKVGQLLSTPLIRNIVGQVQSKLSVRDAMDSGKIVLVNLSKGKLGEDASAFLGSMLVTKFQIDAMSRADIPEAERRDFFLYVDEFQNFATASFATILSEARKYRLSLTMANQYVSQLLLGDTGNTQLRDAVFGNVGTLVSFQIGAEDAEVFSEQFELAVTANDILSLPKYHAYMRLMINGMPSKPFSVSTLPPPKPEGDTVDRLQILRRLSREQYSEKRDVVEEKIRRWALGSSEAKKTAVSDAKAKEKEAEEKEKAKKKGMSLQEYRTWRDRELWTNEFNALRKKKLLEEALTAEEEKLLADLQTKLEKSGGVPEVSKALKEQIEKRAQRS